MNFIISFIRTLFRHRWFMLGGTTLVTLFIIYYTRHMSGGYDVKATLYTGIASGYNLENDKRTDWAMVQNSMDNLISIIQAESTLKKVSIRLFARVLINGSSEKDQNGISANSYQYTYNHLHNSPYGKEILSLIDKSSEDKTVANLENYIRPDINNYVYGLFYFNHPYYGSNVLKRIQVQRRLSSDLLDISYGSSDPGIAYNTVSILMDEFVNEYRRIRYGETDKVIEYFKGELDRIGKQLRSEEDDLTDYNVDKRIINYLDETKEIASISREYELREQDALFAYNSSKAMLEELEKQMDSNSKQMLKNLQFVDKLKEASSITGKISEVEAVSTSENNENKELNANKKRLVEVREELNKLTDSYVGHKYTKEGVGRTNIISQWLDQTLLFEKAKAELKVVQQARADLNGRYVFYAPVGTTIKRKERSISFIEKNYLTMLQSYNEALLRKKNLEMTSATLKVLNAPIYPISPNPTNRKHIVMAVCAGTLLLIIAFLLLIELFDRTLRDAPRARKVTGFKVIGSIPSASAIRYGGLITTYISEATKELSNSLLVFLNERKACDMFVVNLISTTGDSGKSEVGKLISENWEQRGLKVEFISYKQDFDIDSPSYILAKSIADFYIPRGEDILIVEYPPLDSCNIPSELLRDANVNLLVAPADQGWKNVDTQLSHQLQTQIGDSAPLFMCLTQTRREAVEDFTGLLPPYTLLRRITYRLSQLSLTEKIKGHRSVQKEIDNDDE